MTRIHVKKKTTFDNQYYKETMGRMMENAMQKKRRNRQNCDFSF